MRYDRLSLALFVLFLACCKEQASQTVPDGFELTEQSVVNSEEECVARVRDHTKGGDIMPEQVPGGTTYTFTLNSGYTIWQKCAVDEEGRSIYLMARSREPLH